MWKLAIYNVEANGWYSTGGRVPTPSWSESLDIAYTFTDYKDLIDNAPSTLTYSLDGFGNIAFRWVWLP